MTATPTPSGPQAHAAARVARLKARLDHPIVDADGHSIECWPLLDEYCRAEGIAGGVAEVRAARRLSLRARWASADMAAAPRVTQSPWWIFPAGRTDDFAAASIPGLLDERLEEVGIDFAVVYPTEGLTFPHVPVPDLRRRACRALNRYHHDAFSPYARRMAVPAVIPMHDPHEALDEIEYAVAHLGFKTIAIPSYVERPAARSSGDDLPYRLDMYGIDSDHDYDPVWEACIEHRVSIGTHSSSQGIGFRTSPSNYMYNHIGHFAASGEAVCKSLFMGGVTHRFPALRIAFLEGGVGAGAGLLADLCGHWQKRNPLAIGTYDPANIDGARFDELLRAYGSPAAVAAVDRAGAIGALSGGTRRPVDDWARCGVASIADIVNIFTRCFFFGCEADDPMTAVAFAGLGGLPRLNALFSSDIGHWDVPDMASVLTEAFEPVERGFLSPAGFRAFAFEHVVRFYTDTNPTFFSGTAIEDALGNPGNPAARPATVSTGPGTGGREPTR